MQQDLSYFIIFCVQIRKSKALYFWKDRTALKLIPAALDQVDSVSQDKRKHIQQIYVYRMYWHKILDSLWSRMRIIWLGMYVT